MNFNKQPQGASRVTCYTDLRVALVDLQLQTSAAAARRLLTGLRSSQSFLLASATPRNTTIVYHCDIKTSQKKKKRVLSVVY